MIINYALHAIVQVETEVSRNLSELHMAYLSEENIANGFHSLR